jgi:hypothetical protein
LWKTYEEFNIIFDSIGDDDITPIINNAKSHFYKDFNDILNLKLEANDVPVLETRLKEHTIKKSDILIEIEGQYLPYTQVFKHEYPKPEQDIKEFFYIYYPKNISIDKKQRDYLIHKIHSYK